MTTQTSSNPLVEFQWSRQPEAAAMVREILDDFLARCPDAQRFVQRLHDETGTRFMDWVDVIINPVVAGQRFTPDRLREVGYELNAARKVWMHPGGMFPVINFVETDKTLVMVKVESVVDFLAANRLADCCGVSEPPYSASRHVFGVFADDGAAMGVVERHGGLFEPPTNRVDAMEYAKVSEMFRLRKRSFKTSCEGFADARKRIAEGIEKIGISRTCRLFFAAEREYWTSRNRAAQVQHARQQSLGLGWANHDHHTYRSSREHFADLIGVMEMLGLVCRERFYAGKEAGWGAQVMEQPDCGIVVFADVDLSPEEVAGDFSHNRLSSRDALGTVGLWCALHGEAFLQAGMHHLECQFDYEAAREQLDGVGVASMKPFTFFPHLKQAFTQGEVWPVDPKRIDALLARKAITPQQAEKFRTEGALGSHLEILQRDEGYKGFNQTGINEIILKTDPRGQSFEA